MQAYRNELHWYSIKYCFNITGQSVQQTGLYENQNRISFKKNYFTCFTHTVRSEREENIEMHHVHFLILDVVVFLQFT
jgi:hypothetical protein